MCAKDDGDLDLTGINDEELSTYLCASDHEVLNRKRCFWNPEYDVFLKEKASKYTLYPYLSSKAQNLLPLVWYFVDQNHPWVF